jgi:hypothetical protein
MTESYLAGSDRQAFLHVESTSSLADRFCQKALTSKSN